jgi:flagellar biosynthesis/type III secretory pathway chaperone
MDPVSAGASVLAFVQIALPLATRLYDLWRSHAEISAKLQSLQVNLKQLQNLVDKVQNDPEMDQQQWQKLEWWLEQCSTLLQKYDPEQLSRRKAVILSIFTSDMDRCNKFIDHCYQIVNAQSIHTIRRIEGKVLVTSFIDFPPDRNLLTRGRV